MSPAYAMLRPMQIGRGARAALSALSPRSVDTVEASIAPYQPIAPPPAIASPWADSPSGAVVFSDLFGADYTPMTRSEAMSIPAVMRSRNLIATTLGRIPFTVTDRAGNDVVDGTCLHLLDPEQAPFVLKTWTVDDLIFFGLSYWLVLSRFSTGKPATVRRVHPGQVDVDKLGRVTRVYGQVVDPRDVIRIDGPHEGILNIATRSLRAMRSLEQSAARFASNPVPATELHQTKGEKLTKTERDDLVQQWAKARQGENGGVAYTSEELQVIVHGAPSENLLLSGRNLGAIDCARLVGVPADAIDATPDKASMTYANVETRLRVLVDYGLAAYAAAIISRLSMNDVLVAGTTAGFAGLKLDELDTDAGSAGADLSPVDPAQTTQGA